MIVKCGFYDVDTNIKQRHGFKYFVAKHRNNPTNVEIVFVKGEKLEGKKELCLFIENEKLIT